MPLSNVKIEALGKDKSMFCSGGSGYADREHSKSMRIGESLYNRCHLHWICIVTIVFRNPYKHPLTAISFKIVHTLNGSGYGGEKVSNSVKSDFQGLFLKVPTRVQDF